MRTIQRTKLGTLLRGEGRFFTVASLHAGCDRSTNSDSGTKKPDIQRVAVGCALTMSEGE